MRWEKVSRCRCAGTGIKPSASCSSRKRCGGELWSVCNGYGAKGGGHTQATGIIQLLNKEEDMMKEANPFVLCLCTKSWVWRAVWGETFTHGSVRGWGWNSLALLDLCPTSIISAPTVIVGESWVCFDDRWGENYLFREQVLQGHDTYEITAVFIVNQPVCSD